jgi:hypothetical protein
VRRRGGSGVILRRETPQDSHTIDARPLVGSPYFGARCG